ncbi:MAG: HAMP domain-containing histidine kinase [Marinilabiliales bacterium]|nr:HAMP domain-containing histidine kinase [Marinilabiliales bacterium]
MSERKQNPRIGHLLLAAVFVMLGLTFGWGPLFFRPPGQEEEGKRIYAVFEGKEKLIKKGMVQLETRLHKGLDGRELWSDPPEGGDPSGIFYTVTRHDSLIYWNSSLVAFDRKGEKEGDSEGLRKLPTGWFYLFIHREGIYEVVGYMLIKRDFPYQNKYIHSSFQEDFHLPDACEVISEDRPGTIRVFCHEGKFHFGIVYKGLPAQSAGETHPVLLFYLLFLVFLLIRAGGWIVSRKWSPGTKLIGAFLVAIAVYLLQLFMRIPKTVYSHKIFAPAHFSWSPLLPSLGDDLVLSILFLFIAFLFFIVYRKRRFTEAWSWENVGLQALAVAIFWSVSVLFGLLLKNSGLSLELYTNFAFSWPNLVVATSLAIQLLGLGLILTRWWCCQSKPGNQRFTWWILMGLFSLLIQVTGHFPMGGMVAFLLLLLLMGRVGAPLMNQYKISTLLVYGLFMALGFNIDAQREIESRKQITQKVMAVNLATERDPAAEIFLTDFEAKAAKDSLISGQLTPPYHNLESYLKEKYFTGFWKNYEIQMTVCAPSDSVFLTDERKRYPCLDFFNELKRTKGVVLPGSGFYFMDRLNGRISYLGELQLKNPNGIYPLHLFIELNSKIVPEGKGYPQLLLDQQANRRSRDDQYSYAKYFDNKLVDRNGSFLYDPQLSQAFRGKDEFTFVEKDGYAHCIYKRSGENYVVVSYPIHTWSEKGSGFPPLFLLLFLAGFLWIFVAQRLKLISVNRRELRGKIQFTLVATLFVALFVTGLGLIRYNYLELQRSVKEDLDQKVRAIAIETGNRIGRTEKLETVKDYLEDQLLEISDITWTDINVYEPDGRLAASSRNEIFQNGLTSSRMNPEAFQVMSLEKNVSFLHNESLGKMEFFSVYAPLYNQSDLLVGYVNLPYFNRQDEFTRQVTGFIAAFINLYIFLVLLFVVIALLISSQLTTPLSLIEEKLRGIALGKRNAAIEYGGDDEIGRLVQAYNKKVEELAVSAELLARSERESAWKEMARQVAHEIRNPLTPMKLNIQYLRKIKEENASHFDAYFLQVTEMLVAQIDALSNIAASFSDFARMPLIQTETFDLSALIREVSMLFQAGENYTLQLTLPKSGEIPVSGDREQIRRALVNILRNSVQATQHLTGGVIEMALEIRDDKAVVSIADNGIGIPEKDRDRLFEPSFTTKSGGMGLGLAISKSILESCHATIGFESRPGATTFTIAFPVEKK